MDSIGERKEAEGCWGADGTEGRGMLSVRAVARGDRKEVDKFALIFETEVKEFIMDLIKKK